MKKRFRTWYCVPERRYCDQNSRCIRSGRVTGKPYLIGLGKCGRPSSQNLFRRVEFKAGSAFAGRPSGARPLRGNEASAIHVRCMDRLTEDAVREIQQIHSSWIEFEVAGENHSLMALCADDIELWPPGAQPVLGRVAVSAQLAFGTARIHRIEITDRRIRGSNEIAYLTASYKTTFSSAEDSTPRQALGSHLWILEKRAGGWVVTLVSWSVWRCAGIP
jgi:ketosteroid isomerase-like protein